MTQSSWVNPNGLPADEQISSARDMAILARAILRELPEYELYWHIPAIKFGRRVMRNTNSLIGRYPDADGMKTGFICASGFNVVATAPRNGRKLIVVVFGSRSGMVRSEKAAQLFEKGFNSGGLSWLMPSLGTVDALQPIAAAPPNLRDEMCGKHRRRPAAEDADEEEETVASGDPDQSSAYAVTMQSLRGRVARGPILQDYAITTPPIPVFAGAGRKGGEPETRIVTRPGKKKPATATAAVAPVEPKDDAKPATVNASAGGFSLTPTLKRLGIGTFTPASAETKPIVAPEPATQAEPQAKPKKRAARPAKPKADAKAKPGPKAKPDPKAKTAAKKPDPKSTKQ